MSTRSNSNQMPSNSKGICCHSISDIMEWFIIIIIVCLAAISEMPFIDVYQGYVPAEDTPSSITNIEFATLTFGPIYFVFILNVLILKITTYWQYQKEMSVLRSIEIAKNRKNQRNKLKALNHVSNNKHSNAAILSHLLTLTKSVLFALSLSQLVMISLKIYIASSIHNHRISNSFPSKFASVSMSTNCLLFLCMMHSFRSIQSTYFEHKYNGTVLEFTSINSHCLNGNAYFGSNIWFVLRHIKVLSAIILTMPLWCSVYIGLTQIMEHTDYLMDVMGGFAVAMFCAAVSYNTFKDELLFEMTIPTLSVLMEMQSEQNESRDVSPFASMSAGAKTFVVNKPKFPELGIEADTFAAYGNSFGSHRNEYNVEDLEEIALHIGGSHFISRKTSSGSGSTSSRSIETDMDGVDVGDEEEDVDIDDIEIELIESEETMSTFDGIDMEDDDEENGTNTITITHVSRIGEEGGYGTSSRSIKRASHLLYNHRKNMTLRLAPPISVASTKSTKVSQLSPLSMDYEKEQRNIVTPKELYFSNVRSIGTMATGTTLSPLSVAARSGRSYQNFVE